MHSYDQLLPSKAHADGYASSVIVPRCCYRLSYRPSSNSIDPPPPLYPRRDWQFHNPDNI
jgi:hypothetical protein